MASSAAGVEAMNVFACTKEHIPAVVELVTGKPAHVDPSEHAALCEYFREVYFGNPWYDPELPSLVCGDGCGRIAGFYGLIPRPMVFENGAQVRALAPSLLWVRDDGHRPADPLVALRLVKACLNGPQDLTVANGANWPSKKIWESCGGVAAPLYSLDWFRPDPAGPCAARAHRAAKRSSGAARAAALSGRGGPDRGQARRWS